MLETYELVIKENKKLREEIEKLKNIIDSLERQIKEAKSDLITQKAYYKGRP